ncbi:hypothetical protein FOZ62_014119 [Perkinsus olseni]|nr:hypothetical protein FOZ62_014119 [Perkinsus olseni]
MDSGPLRRGLLSCSCVERLRESRSETVFYSAWEANSLQLIQPLWFPCPDLDDEYALTEQEALGSSDDEGRDGTAESSELDDSFLAGI